MELNIHRLPVKSEISDDERALVEAIQGGLPLVERPYLEVANALGITEQEVIEGIARLQAKGVIKRFGVVVRHRELGFRFNAMVVWDIPDSDTQRLGQCIGKYPFVTLCYQRPRRLPAWRYNLFSMIHGRDRDEVLANIKQVVEQCGLSDIHYDVLFSDRRFKQRGAHYRPRPVRAETPPRTAEGNRST